MHFVSIALIGSLLSLDTTIAFQILISQPIFACMIIGYFFGDPAIGLQVGFFLQLVWLIRLPIGAAVVPEGNTAAIVTTALLVELYNGENFYSLLITCFLYGLLISFLGGELVVLYRKTNTTILHKLLKYIKKDKFKYVNYVTYFSLFFHFVIMYVLIFCTLIFGEFIMRNLHNLLPSSWEIIFKYGAIGLLGIGVGMVLSLYKKTTPRVVLLFGIIIGNGLFFIML
jgi:PTS system mannose-specific IIC component